MDPSKTVAEVKLSFLRDQIRILSTALEPSEGWRDYGPEVNHDIPDKVVVGVLQKCKSMIKPGIDWKRGSFLAVNMVFGQHHRAVYSTQACHHVSQQIERLYLNSIDPELGGDNAQGFTIGKETDLTDPEYATCQGPELVYLLLI